MARENAIDYSPFDSITIIHNNLRDIDCLSRRLFVLFVVESTVSQTKIKTDNHSNHKMK